MTTLRHSPTSIALPARDLFSHRAGTRVAGGQIFIAFRAD